MGPRTLLAPTGSKKLYSGPCSCASISDKGTVERAAGCWQGAELKQSPSLYPLGMVPSSPTEHREAWFLPPTLAASTCRALTRELPRNLS